MYGIIERGSFTVIEIDRINEKSFFGFYLSNGQRTRGFVRQLLTRTDDSLKALQIAVRLDEYKQTRSPHTWRTDAFKDRCKAIAREINEC